MVRLRLTAAAALKSAGAVRQPTAVRPQTAHSSHTRRLQVKGWRRVFAHTCDIFFARGIARPETLEMSSLSVEEHPESEVVVTLFEVEATPESVQVGVRGQGWRASAGSTGGAPCPLPCK